MIQSIHQFTHALIHRLIHGSEYLIETWKYPGVFLVLCLCGFIPIPEDVPLIFTGWMVQQGRMDLALAGFCAWSGIIAGDSLLYVVGRRFGRDLGKIPFIGGHVNQKRLAQVEKWFDAWGIWVVAIGRMFAGIREAMVLVAGATKFSYFKFVIADGLAAIVSGGLFVLLGWKLGRHSEDLKRIIGNIKGGMLIGLEVLVLAILIYTAWRQRLARRHARRVLEAVHASGESPSPKE